MKSKEAIRRSIEVIRRKHLSYATEDAYTFWLRKYMAAIKQMPNDLPSEKKLERFLTELAMVQNVAASTQNQAFNAIVFFYKEVLQVKLGNVDSLRAKRPAHIRLAPSVEEVRTLLATVKDVGGYPTNLIVQMLYGCGLRVSEACSLRIKDVRVAESRLLIIGGKGQKDRVVKFPCSIAEAIRYQMARAKAIWERDCSLRIPVQLPHLLAKKYPESQFSWHWAWLFPAHYPCSDPRAEDRTVRWHVLPDMVQRAVKQARRKLGIMVVPHQLRHAYATHSLDRGVNIKALQAAMGHAHLETTANYCHAEALSVPSPLDNLNYSVAV